MDGSQTVIVHWDNTTAVETTWEVFAHYWDDFCYPSSDDVDISRFRESGCCVTTTFPSHCQLPVAGLSSW